MVKMLILEATSALRQTIKLVRVCQSIIGALASTLIPHGNDFRTLKLGLLL
jgi:hypothetical protein